MITSRNMNGILTAVQLCFYCCAATSGEYWISPTNSLGYLTTATQLGLGSWEDPYRGNFDVIISSIPSSSTIHLWPGVYWSAGQVPTVTTNFDQKWKAGSILRGSEIDSTILRITNEPGSQNQLKMIYTTNDSVQVSDLTAEYSVAPSAVQVRDGVELFGSNSKIDRVKVTGLYGTYPNLESFALKVGNNTAHTGCRIADCEVSGPFYGNFLSATIASGEAVVRNNRVIFDKVASEIGDNEKYNGLGFADANHVSFLGNYQYGGSTGVASDYGACTNVVAAGNHFRLTKYPLTMVITNNSQHWRDIFFVKNVIESDCDYSWSSYIATTNGASITNIVIADNTMVPYRQSTNRTVALNIQGIGATQRQMAGIRIFRNVWPTNTEHSLWFYPPQTMSDNLDVDGVPHHLRKLAKIT